MPKSNKNRIPGKFNLRFVSNGGTVILKLDGTEVITRLYNEKSPIFDDITVHREGYTFQGWYSDKTLTTQFTKNLMPAANTTVYAKWIVNTLLEIAKSAIQAYEKIGTPEFEIYFQKYVSCLKSQFFKYLCEIYKYDETISASSTVALQQEKAHNLLTNTYMALMSNSTKIRSLVVNFKPEKGTVESKEEAFIRYFTHTVKLDGIKEGQVEKNNDISHGVTKKFNNAEISLLRRIIKFKQDYEIENITDEYLKWFCEEHNLSYKKIRDIWQKNCDSYVISGEITNNEADFTEFDKTAFAEYIKKEYDIDFDEEFLIFLEELNKLYYKSFSNNQKRMYPPCFTRDYIEEYINIMRNNKASYIAGLTYNRARYANGRYVCVRGEVFDYVIETGENVQQNQIADYFKVSGPYIAKLKKEVEVKIKENIKKTF